MTAARPLTIAGILLFLLLPGGCTKSRPSGPPHVVLLVADDLGHGDVGYLGSKIKTPNLDRLAGEGLRLDRFRTQPECTPSRAALLTGRHPIRFGLSYSVIRPWAGRGIPTDVPLLSDVFRAGGYETALVGKWHLGHETPEELPNRRGFDHFYGHLNGRIDYFTHDLSHAELRSASGLGLDWQRDGVSVREEGYATRLLAREAVRRIEERDPAKPLFLYVSWNAPHPPLQAPPETVAGYDDVFSDARRRTYAAMVTEMDRGTGEILQALESEGIADRTIVWFFSDNGGSVGKGASNGTLQGGKSSALEGGIRVPSILRYPRRLEAGRRSEQDIVLEDVAPTLLAATGVSAAWNGQPLELDGLDLWNDLQDGAIRPRQRLFFACQRRSVRHHALLSDGWKLIWTQDTLSGETATSLFHVAEDPLETRNLADAERARADALQADLRAWLFRHPSTYERPGYHPPPGWEFPADWAEATRQ